MLKKLYRTYFFDLWKRRKTLEISKTLKDTATAVKYKVIN